MLKVFYLISIIWNGGIGSDGVLSGVYTFSNMGQCRESRVVIQAIVLDRYPGKPSYTECIEVEFQGI